jgi:hypothetical protein
VRALQPGSVVEDATGKVWFVRHMDRRHFPNEIWLCPFSDEYAVVLRPEGVKDYNLEEVRLPLRVMGVSGMESQG